MKRKKKKGGRDLKHGIQLASTGKVLKWSITLWNYEHLNTTTCTIPCPVTLCPKQLSTTANIHIVFKNTYLPIFNKVILNVFSLKLLARMRGIDVDLFCLILCLQLHRPLLLLLVSLMLVGPGFPSGPLSRLWISLIQKLAILLWSVHSEPLNNK